MAAERTWEAGGDSWREESLLWTRRRGVLFRRSGVTEATRVHRTRTGLIIEILTETVFLLCGGDEEDGEQEQEEDEQFGAAGERRGAERWGEPVSPRSGLKLSVCSYNEPQFKFQLYSFKRQQSDQILTFWND